MNFKYNNRVYEFEADCLAMFESNRQRKRLSREIGGQLFARFVGDVVRIETATITKGGSKRSRFGFLPDRSAEKADIKTMFDRGLHYVGDWHTHPEPIPSPSPEDRAKMLEIFRESIHELDSMLMVIIGQEALPRGLFVGAVNKHGVISLYRDA